MHFNIIAFIKIQIYFISSSKNNDQSKQHWTIALCSSIDTSAFFVSKVKKHFLRMHTVTLLWCSLLVSHASADMADGFWVKAVCQLVWSMPIGSDTDGAEIFLLYCFQNHIYSTSLPYKTGEQALVHAGMNVCLYTNTFTYFHLFNCTAGTGALWVFPTGNCFLTKTEAFHIFHNQLWHFWLRQEGHIWEVETEVKEKTTFWFRNPKPHCNLVIGRR